MYVSYRLPPVEIRRNDLEFIWSKVIDDLFEADSKGMKRGDIESQVTGITKNRPNAETIRNHDVDTFLGSGLLSPSLAGLDMRMSAHYTSPLVINLGENASIGNVSHEKSETGSRMLSLKFVEKAEVHIELDGTSEWISRARGLLDPILTNKKRTVLRSRASFVIGWALLPMAAVLGLAMRYGTPPVETVFPSVVYLMMAYLFLDRIATSVYPRSLIIIDEAAVRQPWYAKRLGDLWGGVAISIIAGIVLATVGA